MATKKKQESYIKLQIVDFRPLDFSVHFPAHSELDLTKKDALNGFNYNVTIEHKVDFKRKSLLCEVSIVLYPVKNLDFEIGAYKAVGVFIVDDFDEVIPVDKDGIPEDVINSMTSLTIGAVRGAMSVQFKGTILGKFTLPLFSATQLFGDYSEEIEEDED